MQSESQIRAFVAQAFRAFERDETPTPTFSNKEEMNAYKAESAKIDQEGKQAVAELMIGLLSAIQVIASGKSSLMDVPAVHTMAQAIETGSTDKAL